MLVIDQYLQSKKLPTGFEYRKTLWPKYGNAGTYSGTPEQNSILLQQIKNAYNDLSLNQIDQYLKQTGREYGFTIRKNLWSKYGFGQELYRGYANQNDRLLDRIKKDDNEGKKANINEFSETEAERQAKIKASLIQIPQFTGTILQKLIKINDYFETTKKQTIWAQLSTDEKNDISTAFINKINSLLIEWIDANYNNIIELPQKFFQMNQLGNYQKAMEYAKKIQSLRNAAIEGKGGGISSLPALAIRILGILRIAIGGAVLWELVRPTDKAAQNVIIEGEKWQKEAKEQEKDKEELNKKIQVIKNKRLLIKNEY